MLQKKKSIMEEARKELPYIFKGQFSLFPRGGDGALSWKFLAEYSHFGSQLKETRKVVMFV